MSISKADFQGCKGNASYYYSGLDQCLFEDKILYREFIYIHKYVPFLKKSLHQKLYLTIFHLAGNTIRACQSLGCHILALESDMEVFTKGREPLVEVATPKLDIKHVHSFSIDFPIKKRSKRLLDYE
jgi:hypothetical protein